MDCLFGYINSDSNQVCTDGQSIAFKTFVRGFYYAFSVPESLILLYKTNIGPKFFNFNHHIIFSIFTQPNKMIDKDRSDSSIRSISTPIMISDRSQLTSHH